MPPTLTSAQSAKIESQRKDSKPQVYNPNGTSATPISNDFEAWLIVASGGVKSQLQTWIEKLLQQDTEKDYQDLLKETLDTETATLTAQLADLEPTTGAYSDWKSSNGVRGWEDVAEIAWMLQELEAGNGTYTLQEELQHRQAFCRAANARLVTSPDSVADKKTRLGAWIGALNSY